jgi:hypothetical protein
MKIDPNMKINDIVAIIFKKHPVEDPENYTLMTTIDVRCFCLAVLVSDRCLARATE